MDKKFIKRPLLITSISVALTMLLAMLLLPTLITALIILLVTALIMLIFALIFRIKGRIIYKFTLPILLGVVISLSAYTVNYELKKEDSGSYFGNHSLEGYITDISYNGSSGAACYMTLTSIDGKRTNINTYCLFDERIPDVKYSTLSFDAELSDITSIGDGMASDRSFVSSGIFLLAQAKSVISEHPNGSRNIRQFFGKLNQNICSYISSSFDSGTAGLINALLFGDRSGLDSELSRDFRTLGITHMLVVSGMNIALIAGEIESIFKLLRIKRPIRILSCITVCILYMALCGFTLSVVRAALMQIICRISVLFKRQNDSYTSLFFSMALIVTFTPGAIFDIGLILSFLATLGLISFPDRLLPDREFEYTGNYRKPDRAVTKLRKILNSVLCSVLSGMFACIFTLPICCLVFGEMSVLGPFATCLFSVFLDALLFMTPLFLIFSFVPFLGSIISFVMTLLCNAIVAVITKFAPVFRDMLVPLNGEIIEILILMLILSSMFAIFVKPKSTKNNFIRIAPAITLWVVISLVALFAGNADGVYYFNSDKNEAVIVNRNGYSSVIDISSGAKSFARKARAACLSSLGKTNVDELILTHLHGRHITEVEYFATNGYLKKVIMPESADDDEESIADAIITLSKRYGFEYEIYENTDRTEKVYSENMEFEKSVRFYGNSHSHQEIVFSLKVFDSKMIYISTSDIPYYIEMPALNDTDALVFGSHISSYYQRPVNLIFDDETNYIFANRDIQNMVTSFSHVTVSEKETPVKVFK